MWHTVRVVKRPRDLNQLAKLVVDIATGEISDSTSEQKRKTSPKRAGGLKGGKTRAKRLSREQRQEIARLAAHARWKK